MLIYSSTQPKRTGFIHYSDTRTGERRVGFAYMRILVNGQSIRLHVCGFALQRYWNTSVKRSAVTQRFVCHAKDHLNVIICMRVDNVQSSFLDSVLTSEARLRSGASVQRRTRTKHQRRSIYQPRPGGRFTAPVEPPCLKDDTVCTDRPKLTESK